ncbi:hypothetical protein M9435_003744 [Picochlorum sp. BPE23]|nr:hypothetical protein M9435_003744 [Picochlorum sp. BPE23]
MFGLCPKGTRGRASPCSRGILKQQQGMHGRCYISSTPMDEESRGWRVSASKKSNTNDSGDEKSFGESLGESVRDLFDFAKWAPRSSQAWRLGQDPGVSRSSDDEDGGPSPAEMTQDDVDVLNKRLAEQQRSGSVEYDDGSDFMNNGKFGEEDPSFLRSTDEEFAEALNARITEVASDASSNGTDDDGEEDAYQQLTGDDLVSLIKDKYGKKHDVAFVKRDIPGKTLVCLNIYHAHLGQKSFPMTVEDFEEKMDAVALSLQMWDQVERVVSFLKSPVAPRRGLPSRPIVGNAVSIPLELTPDQIVEWFGR